MCCFAFTLLNMNLILEYQCMPGRSWSDKFNSVLWYIHVIYCTVLCQNGFRSTQSLLFRRTNCNKWSTPSWETTTSRKRRWEFCCSSFSIAYPSLVPVMSTCFYLSQEAERQRKKAEQQQEDEEGWVKVTRGPKGAKARPHSEAANKRTLQKEMRKKKRKELMNFYTWQHRNTQKERKWQILFIFLICRLEFALNVWWRRETFVN